MFAKSWHFLLLKLVILAQLAASCKELGNIYPCYCSTDSFNEQKVIIRCSYVSDVDRLREPFRQLVNKLISSVVFSNCQLPYLPGSIFNGLHIDSVYLKQTNLSSIQGPEPEGSPWTGVVYILQNINVADSYGPQEWRWSDIAVLKRLIRIQIENTPMKEIGNLGQISNVQSLVFRHTNTQVIDQSAFADMTSLVSVEVSHNQVSTLSRSMFSQPTSHIKRLYFRDNKIRSLPSNIFEKMPYLEWIDFSLNELKTLPSALTSNIQILNIHENPLECDCQMKWIIQNQPINFGGICSSPQHLKGQSLTEITVKDLCNTTV